MGSIPTLGLGLGLGLGLLYIDVTNVLVTFRQNYYI